MEKPIVTYNDCECIFPTFIQQFMGYLPLQNIEWVNPRSRDVRIIKNLDLEIKPYSPEMFPKFTPGAIKHNLYFLHFVILRCDTKSLKSFKEKIQDWLNLVGTKKNQVFYFITKGLDVFISK